jgi:hypothetical protein
MLGVALGDQGLDGAQCVGAALGFDAELDQVVGIGLGGCRGEGGRRQQRGGRNYQSVFHAEFSHFL